MQLSRCFRARAAAVAVGLGLPLLVGAHGVSAAPVPWGTVLVSGGDWAGRLAGLGDLNVYSNGDGSQDQATSYGDGYECVELGQRWAAIRYGEQNVWPVGSAYQMWDVAPNLKIPFLQLPNGGPTPPQFGDLIIFDRTATSSNGHVAVVADTGPGYVDIVEQNWSNQNPVGRARLTISGTTLPPRSGLPVRGWLRSSTAATPESPVLVTSGGEADPAVNATTYGGMQGKPLAQPMVSAAGTPTGGGYWMTASDGGIFAFGDAQFYGSIGGHHINKPVVGLAAMADGTGYWEVASDGGIFAFGGTQFYGSMGGKPLFRPVVGMAATPTGKGYWLVASDGGIFAFGDAQFYGSTGGHDLNSPVVGMAASPTGKGYWLVAGDGGIFAYGDAQFNGSMGGQPIPSPIVGMTATGDGLGYWMSTQGGTLYAFGSAGYYANSGRVTVGGPVVALALTKDR
jgi:hypothetical protein